MSALNLAIVSRNSVISKSYMNCQLFRKWKKKIINWLRYTYMHAFPAFVVRYDDRWHVYHIDVDEGFYTVSYGVVRMEDVVKFRASR